MGSSHLQPADPPLWCRCGADQQKENEKTKTAYWNSSSLYPELVCLLILITWSVRDNTLCLNGGQSSPYSPESFIWSLRKKTTSLRLTSSDFSSVSKGFLNFLNFCHSTFFTFFCLTCMKWNSHSIFYLIQLFLLFLSCTCEQHPHDSQRYCSDWLDCAFTSSPKNVSDYTQNEYRRADLAHLSPWSKE